MTSQTNLSQANSTAQSMRKAMPTPTLEQRKVIYQARRGLKELDMFFDPYVKQHYLTADEQEQATFAKLLSYEDPDLLDYFMNQATPDDKAVAELIVKLKELKASS